MFTNILKGVAILALGLFVTACGVTKSNFSSDWCISTEGLNVDERAWAERACNGGGDDRGFDVRDVNDRDDNTGDDEVPGDDAPGNSGDHRKDGDHRPN